MSAFASGGSRLETVKTLHRVRDVERRQAEARLHSKRMEILRLKQELEGLKQRRRAVLIRRGGPVLRERLLLDALMKITLERGRQLDALNLQSAVLFADYRESKSRRDAAATLHDRRRAERDLVLMRREEEASTLLAAARAFQKKVEEPCEDS